MRCGGPIRDHAAELSIVEAPAAFPVWLQAAFVYCRPLGPACCRAVGELRLMGGALIKSVTNIYVCIDGGGAPPRAHGNRVDEKAIEARHARRVRTDKLKELAPVAQREHTLDGGLHERARCEAVGRPSLRSYCNPRARLRGPARRRAAPRCAERQSGRRPAASLCARRRRCFARAQRRRRRRAWRRVSRPC